MSNGSLTFDLVSDLVLGPLEVCNSCIPVCLQCNVNIGESFMSSPVHEIATATSSAMARLPPRSNQQWPCNTQED